MDEPVSVFDIVQITDPDHHWFPALIIVSEVKSFGIQGYCLIPESNREGSRAAQAFIRLEADKYERCGSAIIIDRSDMENSNA